MNMGSRMDADELRLVVQKLARRIRANRPDQGITDAQLAVLFLLDREGELTPGRIAENEHVTPPSINRTLGGLEEAGWIRRRPDPGDARRVLVSMTDAGTALVGETRRLRTAWFTQRLAELSADDRRALEGAASVLRKLAES